MKNHFLSSKVILIFMCSLFTACAGFAREKVPYSINGEILVGEDNQDFNIAGLDLNFLNKSEKCVENFTLVFFLFDQDGEPVANGYSNIVLKITEKVPANDYYTATVSLDDYLVEVTDETYQLDYLYVSRIEYEDGSFWEDPLGLHAF